MEARTSEDPYHVPEYKLYLEISTLYLESSQIFQKIGQIHGGIWTCRYDLHKDYIKVIVVMLDPRIRFIFCLCMQLISINLVLVLLV